MLHLTGAVQRTQKNLSVKNYQLEYTEHKFRIKYISHEHSTEILYLVCRITDELYHIDNFNETTV